VHVLQCPKCEVRLPSASELKDHLATDHPDFEATALSVEIDLLSAVHRHRDEVKHPVEMCAGREGPITRERVMSKLQPRLDLQGKPLARQPHRGHLIGLDLSQTGSKERVACEKEDRV
jgi:hypothetical protein